MGGRHSKETKTYYLEYGAASMQGGRPKQEDRYSVDLMLGCDAQRASAASERASERGTSDA